ncbi:hypothetical protein FBQ97_00780 [Acidobacteria bacterium ACD]|nr:hypothetical protein [Acidobacteria bacterium ACD]
MASFQLRRLAVAVLVPLVLSAGISVGQSTPAEPSESVSPRNWPAPPFWLPGRSATGVVPDAPRSLDGRETRRDMSRPNALPTGALPFFAITPCRIVDTRSDGGAYGRPALRAYVARAFNIPAGPCSGIPVDAAAFSLNLTVIGAAGSYTDAFLTAWPSGTSMPVVATLNFGGEQLSNNAAVVAAGTAGSIDVLASYDTHLILDINGYYAEQPSVTSLNGISGVVSLVEGDNVSITNGPDSVTIASSAPPGSGLPSGMVAFFALSDCPTGWSAYAAANGRYVVGILSGGTVEGTAGTALSSLEDRPTGSHSHPITDPGHQHTMSFKLYGVYSSSGLVLTYGDPSMTLSSSSSTTGISVNSPSGSVAGTNAPYIQLLACRKN